MTHALAIKPEMQVQLYGRKDQYPLKDIPLGRVFVANNRCFQSSMKVVRYGILQTGDRFRYGDNWYEKIDISKRSCRLAPNMPFGSKSPRVEDFYDTTDVHLLVVDDRGAP